MNRRDFLTIGLIATATVMVDGSESFAASEHKYKLTPENLLPKDIRSAPEDVREAYRFAVANRDTLRYIPCYCGWLTGTPATPHVTSRMTQHRKLIFDRMSLG